MLTALALGPLLAVISYSYQAASTQIIGQAVINLQQGAADGGVSLDDALSERVRQARFLASLSSVRSYAAVQVNDRMVARVPLVADLRALQPTYSYLQTLEILDSKGEITYSTAIRKGVEKDQALMKAVGTGQPFVGTATGLADRPDPVLVVAVPVEGGAILRTETSLQFLMQRAGRQSGAYTLLVDPQGRVIASNGGIAVGETLAAQPDGRLFRGDGETLYAQTATLATLPWKYVVAVSEDQLARQLNDQRGRALLLALGVSLIIGALARLLALGFTRPLAAMAAATRALAAGDLTHEVKPTTRQDEVGQLQNAFAEAYQQLRRLAARMRLSSILVAEAAGHMHSMASESDKNLTPIATASQKLSVVAQDLDRQVSHFKV
ncbi:MAG TPA: methyl-accepting chemotaxis protein [Symbiobacteriaceae bacterium]|nr:methyl-accepting chemotaxis protein [Symbiobacteriaceae bacterium]